MKFLAVFFTIASVLSLSVTAEPRDAKKTVQELSSLTIDMMHFATILRLSEDISFWQSVSIMGAEYDWKFNYNSQGTEVYAWTYRLYNTLDETLSEGIRASQGITRSRVLTDEEKRRGKDLFAQYETMRVHGEKVYRLLKAGDIVGATEIYETEVIQLRRDISQSATSASFQMRDRIKRMALDVRLEK